MQLFCCEKAHCEIGWRLELNKSVKIWHWLLKCFVDALSQRVHCFSEKVLRPSEGGKVQFHKSYSVYLCRDAEWHLRTRCWGPFIKYSTAELKGLASALPGASHPRQRASFLKHVQHGRASRLAEIKPKCCDWSSLCLSLQVQLLVLSNVPARLWSNTVWLLINNHTDYLLYNYWYVCLCVCVFFVFLPSNLRLFIVDDTDNLLWNNIIFFSKNSQTTWV